MERVVILDTETTGLNKRHNGEKICFGHRIVEIACVEIINRNITGNNFHVYIDPQQEIDVKATTIHGITDDFIRGKPSFGSIVGDFLSFIGNSSIVIHNAPFDISFIDQEFGLLDFGKPVGRVFRFIDTLEMARNLFPGERNDLDSLCRRFNLKGRGDGGHGALLDAKLLAEIYLRLINLS